ncbi:MAG: hypothetical protein K0B14_19975, partial [Anaerolineaceae bacterium]|nr:hypothetical protein [Anaerolineaceae bacterium]
MSADNQSYINLINTYIEVSKRMLATQSDMIDQLERMQSSINTIKNWIVFWGVIGVLGAIIWVAIVFIIPLIA